MVHVTPSEMLTARGIVKFIAEIAILRIEQEMYKYGEGSEQVHKAIEWGQLGETLRGLSFHQRTDSLWEGWTDFIS